MPVNSAPHRSAAHRLSGTSSGGHRTSSGNVASPRSEEPGRERERNTYRKVLLVLMYDEDELVLYIRIVLISKGPGRRGTRGARCSVGCDDGGEVQGAVEQRTIRRSAPKKRPG